MTEFYSYTLFPRALVLHENRDLLMTFNILELERFCMLTFGWFYMYFHTIWSYFRLWALLDGIEVY